MTHANGNRTLAFITAVLFLLSWIFPLGAALSSNPAALPHWWGPVDITLAFAVAIAAFALQTLLRAKVDRRVDEQTYRIYRVATHAIIAIAVLAIFAGDRIAWAHCATGFLWRAWLGMYMLPWWLAALS